MQTQDADKTNDPSQKLVEDNEEECFDWGSSSDGEVPPSSDPEKGKPPSENAAPVGKAEKSDGSLCVAICTLMAAVPALIGSWCWPILVGAIFAVAAGNVNGGLVKFFHGVQVAIMFALMTNIVQFAYWNVQKKRKKQGHWYMYKPVYILLVSTVLVLIQPTSMLIIGSWICDGTFSADQLQNVNACKVQGKGAGFCDATTGKWVGSFDGSGNFVGGGVNSTDVSQYIAMTEGTYYSDGCNPDMKNWFFDGGVSNALVPNTTTGWMIQIFGTYLGFILMFVGVCQATMLHHKIMNKWAAIRNRA